MPKEVMDCRASDNEYLHKDFHGALSVGIQYLDDHYGEDAVRRYLRNFASKYYAPLIAEFREGGLPVLRAHFEKNYRDESAEVEFFQNEDELLIRVKNCPAVTHIQQNNYTLARLFGETTRIVNEVLCEGSPFQAEILDYQPETGAGTQRFRRRPIAGDTQ
jgi:hypothetical protein